MPQAPSTRWCPTPEQLMILEEMYRSGVRTPNAPQIQQITAHLSYYGKIEGKNVFYWFQNHKARDRQKLRRRISRHQQLLQQHQMNLQLPQFHQIDASYSSLYQHQILQISPHPHPLQQGCYQEGREAMNLISRLETSEGGEGDLETPVSTCPVSYGYERVTVREACPSVLTCCRQPRTLELFPTQSTGLKEEGSTSKSSSSCLTPASKKKAATPKSSSCFTFH